MWNQNNFIEQLKSFADKAAIEDEDQFNRLMR